MALIQARDLEKIYRNGEVETPALRGVSFDIEKGSFTAIMGPSGSGKSTLLHILGFLDTNTGGEYYFDNKTFSEYSEDERAIARNKKMGFVFQTYNLLPRLTSLENVKLPLLYSEVKESEWKNRAAEAIKAVGMEHRMDHSASQLSGGEKQRIAIARALVNGPQVIFADEPTGNLDSKSGQVIMEILQKLNQEFGHTIILITHETFTAEHAERILSLHDGQLVDDKKVTKRRKAETDFYK